MWNVKQEYWKLVNVSFRLNILIMSDFSYPCGRPIKDQAVEQNILDISQRAYYERISNDVIKVDMEKCLQHAQESDFICVICCTGC